MRFAPAPESAASISRSPDPVVRIQDVSKSFPAPRRWREILVDPLGGKKIPTLRGVSCDIYPGEAVALLGPNGAGKTTLLKILSTLILPDQGTITIAGTDLVRHPDRVKHLVAPVVADERSLSWRLSATENLRFFAHLYNLKGSTVAQRIEEVLEVVELDDVGDLLVGKFSSGMKQRLLIARALLAKPRVLLLDEPTRALDPLSAQRFRAFLKAEIIGRQGCTIILATHNPEEALELSDRVAVLDRGRLLALAPPHELADDLAGERYSVWTTTPDHARFAELAAEGRIANLNRDPGGNGSRAVEFLIPDGAETAADILEALVRANVRILRFEKRTMSLAELIGAVVNQHREDA
jgi:ABC-2 type transport system ATP-binding protein